MTYPFISVAIVLLSHRLLCLFPRLFLLSVALPTCMTFIGLVITHGYFTHVRAAIFPLELRFLCHCIFRKYFVVSTSPPCPLPPYSPTPACQQHASKLIFSIDNAPSFSSRIPSRGSMHPSRHSSPSSTIVHLLSILPDSSAVSSPSLLTMMTAVYPSWTVCEERFGAVAEYDKGVGSVHGCA
jgi:hypothetical protein